MAEITEPTLKLCWNGHAIRRAAEVLRAAGLQLMAEDVEAQFPKPAIEEPEEFGSVVRAGIDGLSDRVLWLRSASGYWFSETSRRAIFSDLHHPEVLRIGVGQAGPPKRLLDFLTELHGLIAWGSIPAQLLRDLVSAFEIDTASADEWARLDAANADTDAYAKGAADTAAKVMRWLRQLRAEALTFERQNAYDKAIKLVEELAP